MYLANSVSEAKQRTKSYYIKNILIGFGIAIAYTLVLVIVFGQQDIRSNANEITVSDLVDMRIQELQCERLLEMGDDLVRKYDLNKNITEWSETDRNTVLEVEQMYQENCVPSNTQIMSNLKKCTITYITVLSLIDEMEERHLDTLSQPEQKAYNKNYQEYFNNFCNRIVDEIEKTDEFIQFNKTRLQ